jgi:hypothetical protein
VIRTTVGWLLIFAMLPGATTLTAAQTPAVDRAVEHMADLKVGRTVTLVLTDGTRVKGRIAAVSAEAVTIRPQNDEPRTVPKGDIAAIHKGMPRWGKVLIGVGVAYGVGWLLILATGGPFSGPVCC